MKLLVVEDDRTIALGLEYSLQQEGYTVTVCDCVKRALELSQKEHYDLYLLDLTLPDGSGYDICKHLKAQGDVPVIFLTACDDEVNVVLGLDMGADDYITKPFRVRELLSRIRSVLRRYHLTGQNPNIIELGEIQINTMQAKVVKAGKEIPLTAMEYKLLLTMVNSQGRVLTRNQLLEGIWDIAGDFVNDNTLTVYIKRLREKLEDDPQNPRIIQTVRGFGYRLGDGYVQK
ncbi:MAG TPA: response regulator transcription factor [Firmicutes bacterium]|nr:response regulator transcription factor [Bacillota bacterium]